MSTPCVVGKLSDNKLCLPSPHFLHGYTNRFAVKTVDSSKFVHCSHAFHESILNRLNSEYNSLTEEHRSPWCRQISIPHIVYFNRLRIKLFSTKMARRAIVHSWLLFILNVRVVLYLTRKSKTTFVQISVMPLFLVNTG